MRRNDREVTDIKQIYDILTRCDTIALGMNGGDAPYIIPMTFACALEGAAGNDLGAPANNLGAAGNDLGAPASNNLGAAANDLGAAANDLGAAAPKIAIYFHSAKGGRKWDILNQNPNVCVEGHIYYKVVQEGNSVTAKYESVIGTGKAQMVTDHQEKVDAFKQMFAQYKQSGFPAESCKGLQNCEVFKVILDEVSGKHNL